MVKHILNEYNFYDIFTDFSSQIKEYSIHHGRNVIDIELFQDNINEYENDCFESSSCDSDDFTSKEKAKSLQYSDSNAMRKNRSENIDNVTWNWQSINA